MLKNILALLLLLFIVACTKDVPETDKSIIQTTEKNKINKLIESFYNDFNKGNIDSALTCISQDYKAILSESDEIVGLENYKRELNQYKTEYPEGRWQYSIEEMLIKDGMGYVIILSSFVMPDPLESKGNPVYSERSMKVLLKDSQGEWKIYRSVSVPLFTY